MNKDQYKYFLSKYGFEEVPCAIPKNNFEYFKRNIYLRIRGRSEKLFFFLQKICPIKFLKERPNGELYFTIKKDGRSIWDLCIEKFGRVNTLDEFSQTGIKITLGSNSNRVRKGKSMVISQEVYIEEVIELDENLFSNFAKIIQTYPDLKGRNRNYLLEQLC
jgi:hypothetical protein